MREKQNLNLGLTAYDDLFKNDSERNEDRLPKIYDIPIELIDDFPDHPFKVKMDEDMDQLVESIKELKAEVDELKAASSKENGSVLTNGNQETLSLPAGEGIGVGFAKIPVTTLALVAYSCIGLSRTSFFCPCPSAFVRCPSQVPLPFGRGTCLASDLRSSEG